jgi:hypothetical protein
VVIDLIGICDLGDIYLLQGSTVLVDLRSTVQIHFGSSGFRSFHLLLVQSSEVSYILKWEICLPRVLIDGVSLLMDGPDSLRDFR